MAVNNSGFNRGKLLFVANTDWYLFNFRLNLIKTAQSAGWVPHLVCSKGEYVEKLKAQGWPVRVLSLSTRGANPLREIWALFQLVRAFRRVRPDVIHLFTLKCVLYGCLAAPLVPKARIVGALTGMGYLFSSERLSARLLKNVVLRMLKVALRLSKAHLIFQNEFDRAEFVNNGLITHDRTSVIRGSGVDCNRFQPAQVRQSAKRLRLLFCGRLIAEKGIRDYLAATAELRDGGYRFKSRIAGAPYPGNPSSLTESEIKALRHSPDHDYLGHTEDIAALLQDTDIVVLPTYYREGTPKVLLEGAATDCIIITTDIPACEGLLEQGVSGCYVEPKNPKALANAIKDILDASPEKRHQMQKASRKIAVQRFSDTQVNDATIALYDPHSHLNFDHRINSCKIRGTNRQRP